MMMLIVRHTGSPVDGIALFARDENGGLLSMELILVSSIALLGTIVGLSAFRDSITQELGDVAAGLTSVDHGYRYAETSTSGTVDNLRFDSFVSGSGYSDQTNFCEPEFLDPVGQSPMCIEITATQIINEAAILP